MAPSPIEREIKLAFDTVDAARDAVVAAGATPLRDRRLQEDCLLDTPDGRLRAQGTALRLRLEGGKSRVTFKGPVQPGVMKVREEFETIVGDGDVLLRIFEALGFRPWFRYQKYREEFSLLDLVVAVDETPLGAYVELEGSAEGIDEAAARLGRTRADYVVQSYHTLFDLQRRRAGTDAIDMLFGDGV
jgi:adenylate cyclase class 2